MRCLVLEKRHNMKSQECFALAIHKTSMRGYGTKVVCVEFDEEDSNYRLFTLSLAIVFSEFEYLRFEPRLLERYESVMETYNERYVDEKQPPRQLTSRLQILTEKQNAEKKIAEEKKAVEEQKKAEEKKKKAVTKKKREAAAAAAAAAAAKTASAAIANKTKAAKSANKKASAKTEFNDHGEFDNLDNDSFPEHAGELAGRHGQEGFSADGRSKDFEGRSTTATGRTIAHACRESYMTQSKKRHYADAFQMSTVRSPSPPPYPSLDTEPPSSFVKYYDKKSQRPFWVEESTGVKSWIDPYEPRTMAYEMPPMTSAQHLQQSLKPPRPHEDKGREGSMGSLGSYGGSSNGAAWPSPGMMMGGPPVYWPTTEPAGQWSQQPGMIWGPHPGGGVWSSPHITVNPVINVVVNGKETK